MYRLVTSTPNNVLLSVFIRFMYSNLYLYSFDVPCLHNLSVWFVIEKPSQEAKFNYMAEIKLRLVPVELLAQPIYC